MPESRRDEPRVVLSAAEERFERRRRTVGLILGPAAFILLLALPPSGLAPAAARLAAVVAWVLIWWITEPVPIPVTALLGPALVVVLGVGSAKETFAPFGDPIIMLFLGGFLIAEAMSVHGLDRRIAFTLLGSRAVAGDPRRVLIAFAVLAAGLSMWVSNTATTAMLYPIALGVLAALERARATASAAAPGTGRFGTGLLLACAYGSSIGGIATPVGTPPNLIAIGQLQALAGIRIGFAQWMAIALPISIAMMVFVTAYLHRRFPAGAGRSTETRQALAAGRAGLGPIGRGERNVVAAFLVAVTLWVVPGLIAAFTGNSRAQAVADLLPEGVVALLAASLLFVLPVDWAGRRFTLDWRAAERLDWGTLLLFGGGLALGGAMFRTGLAAAFGHALTEFTGARSVAALTIAFTVFAIYFTEVTSNTATATMLCPLAIAAAQAAGVSPVPPAIGCALGCSMAFMFPVATPPNAIVYGSGRVPIRAMISSGFVVNLAAAVILPVGVLLLCRLFGL